MHTPIHFQDCRNFVQCKEEHLWIVRVLEQVEGQECWRDKIGKLRPTQDATTTSSRLRSLAKHIQKKAWNQPDLAKRLYGEIKKKKKAGKIYEVDLQSWKWWQNRIYIANTWTDVCQKGEDSVFVCFSYTSQIGEKAGLSSAPISFLLLVFGFASLASEPSRGIQKNLSFLKKEKGIDMVMT